MLPPQKVISFDLDGTLTPSKSSITEEMAKVLQELIKKTKVIVISGGKFGQFQNQFLYPFFTPDFLDKFSHNLVLMPTSGSQRYEYDKTKKEWVMVDKEPLEENIKNKAKKLLQEIIDSGKYEIPPNPYGEIVEDRDTQITFSGLGQQAPVEEKTRWDPDKRKREKIKAALELELPETSILINAYSSIDILPKGFNKAAGITRFLNKTGLRKHDLIFVGDGLFPGGNDYSMYEAGFETVPVKGPEEAAELIRKWVG